MVELNGKKILVTFLMHLGDLTLTTPFIHALRKAAPDSHITMLVDEKLKDVVLFNPYLDEVITIDKKGRDNSILALIACARQLSKHNFDVLINLHPNERCSFIDALTKVKLRTGTTHSIFKWRWDVFTPLDRTMHAADMYLDVLKQLGVKDLTNNGLEIFPGERHIEEANTFWQEHSVTPEDKLIGFNIGSAVVTKRWAPERFAAVADHFANNGYKVVYFGGAMDEEMVQDAVSHMQTTPVIATGAFGIGGLAAAMISQKVPIVAMYGPSNPKLYGPYTKDAIIVTAEPPCTGCAGGMKHQCSDMQCMTRLTVAQVIAAAKKMLNTKGK